MAFEISKEPFHEIVGSLGLESAGALWGGNQQWGRKQLGAVVFDLFEHLLKCGRGGIIGTRPNLFCKGLNFSLEGFHLDGLAVMIESLVSTHRGDVQGLAQLIEQLAKGFQPLEGMFQGPILEQVLEIQAQVVKRQIAPPLFTAARRDEGLELGVDFLRPARQRQQRAIKGEAIALSLLQSRQDPVRQEISR
jgi:hypothetical protein